MVFNREVEGGYFLGFNPAVKELALPIGDEMVNVLNQCLNILVD
jgi:hypothetical protein